jgi:hypothetical protein
VGGWFVTNNDWLENLDGLGNVSPMVVGDGELPSVEVSDNDALPQCFAEALVSRIVDPEYGEASGNDENGVCD